MTHILERAFAEAAKLPLKQQDSLGAWILAELASERKWEKVFAESADALTKLADEALSEHRQGRTKTLDPDKL